MKRIIIILLIGLCIKGYGLTEKFLGVYITGSDAFVYNIQKAMLIISIVPDSGTVNWMNFVTDYGLRHIVEFNRKNVNKLFDNVEPTITYDDFEGVFVVEEPDTIYVRDIVRDYQIVIIHEATHLYCVRTKHLKDYKSDYYPVRMEYFYRGCRRRIK